MELKVQFVNSIVGYGLDAPLQRVGEGQSRNIKDNIWQHLPFRGKVEIAAESSSRNRHTEPFGLNHTGRSYL